MFKTVHTSKQKNSLKLIALLALALLLILLFSTTRNIPPLLSKYEADKLYTKGLINEVELKEGYYILHTPTKQLRIHINALNSPWVHTYPITQKESYARYGIFVLLALLLLWLFKLFKNKSNSEASTSFIGKGKRDVQPIEPSKSNVSFNDVAGISDVKEELEELIDFLRNPQKYKKLDIRLPKGILLEGPPGVGKTLISQAVAGEADVPFFYQSGASFAHLYVGAGAKRVSELFAKAKQSAPSIVFIDEIDAVGKSRGELRNDEREVTLNELLTQMDGFSQNTGVIVIGATNKIDVLDEALLRAGRFDRRIHIGLPDIDEREKILTLTLKNKKHTADIKKLAKLTVGFSSAALSTLTNEAALHALKENRDTLDIEDFLSVKEKVLLGKRRGLSFSEEERNIQACYQGAKAVLASWLDIEYEKIGIVTTKLVESEHELLTRTKLLNLVKFYLSGGIATKMTFNEQYNNTSSDIANAKQIIRQMVQEYGMSEHYSQGGSVEAEIIKECNLETVALLKTLQKATTRVSQHLLEHENITPEETSEILREIF